VPDDTTVIPDNQPGPDEPDNWEHVSICAQNMISAWDHVDMQEEARGIATYSTPRQRAYIFIALWEQATSEWSAWATKWLLKRWTDKPEGEGREDV
jgi:hypothetical protein